MATPPSDDTRRLFKLLDDGDWHNYNRIRDGVAEKVPPGRALRKYQERLIDGRRLRGDNKAEIPLTEDEQIFFGARALAQSTITSWKGRGIIARGEGSEKEIKIRPGFRAWGLVAAAKSAGGTPGTVEGAGGSTEVPPEDSVPSEGAGGPLPEPARPIPEPAAASTEPVVAPMPVPEPTVNAVHHDEADSWIPKTSEDYAWPPNRSTTGSERIACPECGAEILNQQNHDRWHEEQKQTAREQPMALVDEVTLRTLISGEIGQSLDEFQGGMQRYLAGMFAQVERQINDLKPTAERPKSWRSR